MGFKAAADRVDWVVSGSGDDRVLFFCTSPYLNATDEARHGRMVYSASRPYGSASIERRIGERSWFKVTHRIVGERRVSVSVPEMLSVAEQFGFTEGAGIHRNLVRIPATRIFEEFTAPPVSSLYPEQVASVIQDIATRYGISVSAVGVTGSASAIGERYSKLRDLDVVIPLDTREQVEAASRSESECGEYDVGLGENWAKALNRPHSSIRWRHNSGMVICPFFTHGRLVPPVVQLELTNRRAVGSITVTDSTYGVFNTHYYKCAGACSHLMICSTLGRGEVRPGLRVTIDCPIGIITRGAWKGAEVAIVNQPHLGFDRGHLAGH